MPQARRPPSQVSAAVLKDRTAFTSLLAKNPNHFGNLEASTFKPVKKVVGDTFFEQATCVGFNPQTNVLEATIAVKRATGYGGGPCTTGTTEYVRFYLDYGSGWEDQGLTGVRVHDLADARDCAGAQEKPLSYAAGVRIDPRRECCTDPVLPRVRVILSWQWAPPANTPNWQPVWGNVLDCAIQIAPRPWSIFCLLEEIGALLGTKLEVPPLFEQVQYHPIPLPDPPPLELAQLAELYAGGPAKAAARRTKAAAATAVEPHRFGLATIAPLVAQGGFDAAKLTAATSSFESIGLSLEQAIAALEKTNADVSYEELECLGLDETVPERLVATFSIKRPAGYSGDLCHAGSQEYVAFWADWDDTCEWTYLGTVAVNVHDIRQLPDGGLCYSAILPVDLTHHRRPCAEPKVARVRAVLSWAVPPSTTDPERLEYWGNRLDAHVQIAPGDEIPPGEVAAAIRNLGGIAIEDIATGGNGMTLAADVRFAHFPGRTADGWGLQRPCPFGGTIEVEGNFFPGYWYRVKVRRSTDPPTSFTVLGSSFLLERAWSPGYDTQTSVGGFFRYADPTQYFTRILAEWGTTAADDGLWEVQLDVATGPSELDVFASSPWYAVLVDNTGPAAPATMDIHIAAGGDCKDFNAGTTITGTFVADDPHFGGWSLSTEPNTAAIPSNPPHPAPFLAGTTPAPGPSGHGWTLDTSSPVKMKPCGYVVRLEVSDRSILYSHPDYHNSNAIEVGFCLRG